MPKPDDLKTMDWAFQAQPFVDVPAKADVDLKTMDWVYQAQPFVRNYFLERLYHQILAVVETTLVNLIANKIEVAIEKIRRLLMRVGR